MADTDFAIIQGSGNVFRDLGLPGADRAQLRALLAADIIAVLDASHLTVRAAQEQTGIAAADLSRTRPNRATDVAIDPTR